MTCEHKRLKLVLFFFFASFSRSVCSSSALRAFRDKQTSSFRVEKNSPSLQELLDGVHKRIRNEERENMIAQAEFDGESMSEVTTLNSLN